MHEYCHDKSSASYGLEVVEKLGIATELIFKTLVVELDNGQLIVAMLPVAKCFSAKKSKMADKEDVLRSTGYVMGGVSPIGQKKRLKTVNNSSAFDTDKIFVSAGKRGLEVQLSRLDLQNNVTAIKADICL